MITTAAEHDASEWNQFVRSHPDASGYHTWEWRDVFTKAFGHEPVYLIARENGAVVGILPLVYIQSVVFGRSLTSLPFLNYGGIVADSPAIAHALADEASSIGRARHCRHVELRHVARQCPDAPCRQHKVVMHLPLGDGMWERLDKKVRNQVRKAQKSDLVAERGGVALIAEFYTVFARNMRDLGTPVYSRRLFEQVLETFTERAALHVVRLSGQPVAAGLTFRTGDTVEVPWASSIRDYNQLCPNHLLYWHIIETAVAGGCRVLDFGRSTPGEGTFKFKEQWGAQPVALHWEYPWLAGTLPDNSPKNARFHAAIELWKRLPLTLATALGPRIVRGIP